jgi:hypothetical protein
MGKRYETRMAQRWENRELMIGRRVTVTFGDGSTCEGHAFISSDTAEIHPLR